MENQLEQKMDNAMKTAMNVGAEGTWTSFVLMTYLATVLRPTVYVYIYIYGKHNCN